MGDRCVAATSLRCCGGTPGDQDGRGTNELSKIESILGTRMSQNLSRDRRLACMISRKRGSPSQRCRSSLSRRSVTASGAGGRSWVTSWARPRATLKRQPAQSTGSGVPLALSMRAFQRPASFTSAGSAGGVGCSGDSSSRWATKLGSSRPLSWLRSSSLASAFTASSPAGGRRCGAGVPVAVT